MRKVLVATAAALAIGTGAIITAPPAAATNSQYVRWIHEEIDGSYALSNTQIIRMGKLVCRALDTGNDAYEIGETIMDTGFTMDEAAAWVVGAVYFICPRHKWMIA